MFGDPLADDRTAAGDDVKYAVGQPRLFKNTGQQQSRTGCDLGGFRHQRTAGGQNIGVAFCANKEREVPRRDDADDADGFASHQTQHVVAEIIKAVAIDAARQAGGIFPDIGRALDLAARLGDRFTGFQRFQQRQFRKVLANELGGFQQYRRTRCAANARPFSAVKSVSGCLYRLINVFNGSRRIGANDNIVGRAFTDKTFAAVARGPFAIDEHLKFTRFFRQQRVVNVYRVKCITHRPLPIVHSLPYRSVRASE